MLNLLVFPRADIADFGWWFIRLLRRRRLFRSWFRHGGYAGSGFFSPMTTATTTAGQTNDGRHLFWWIQHDHCHFTRRFNCRIFWSFQVLRLPRTDDVVRDQHFGRTLLLGNGRFDAGATATTTATTGGGGGRSCRRRSCACRLPRTDIHIRRWMTLDAAGEAALLGRWATDDRSVSIRLIDWRARSQQNALCPPASGAERRGWINRLPRADVVFPLRRRNDGRRFTCTARSGDDLFS